MGWVLERRWLEQTDRIRETVTSPPIPRYPPLYILDFTVYLLYFLAPSPLSMPIQYLFKHYFMPLARETFTFKFSNIPQSLVCKQHMSVLQLLPLSEAVGIKPSHARLGRWAGAQDSAAATELQSPRQRPHTEGDAPAEDRGESVKHPQGAGPEPRNRSAFPAGINSGSHTTITQKSGQRGEAP